ncbi:hypothetical protein CMUS01_00650, partial [Colletotrichum musicola]
SYWGSRGGFSETGRWRKRQTRYDGRWQDTPIWKSQLTEKKDDLGIQRVEDLPLDNTPGRNYSQMPVRRAPRNIENSEALQGYQDPPQALRGAMSKVVVRPGAQVRQFNTSGVPSNNPAPSATPKGPQQVPPHLRKIVPAGQASARSETVVTQVSKVETKTIQATQVKTKTARATQVKAEPAALTKSPTDRIVWSGKCLMSIPGKAVQNRPVVVELNKRESDAEYPYGLVSFVMTSASAGTSGQRASCTHNLEDFALSSQKLNQCVINFGPSGATYSLQFDNVQDAETFISLAGKLQQVMKYLVNANLMSDGAVDKNTIAAADKPADPADKKPAVTTDKPAATADKKPAASVKKKPAAPGKPKDLVDAFGQLSLDNVKGSSMYKSQPPRPPPQPRIQYTAEELFKRRPSGEAPEGIQDVKIPHQKDNRGPVRLPPHLQQHCKKTVTAEQTTSKTENTVQKTTVVTTLETVSKTEAEPDMIKLDVTSAPSTTSVDSAVEFHSVGNSAAGAAVVVPDVPVSQNAPVAQASPTGQAAPIVQSAPTVQAAPIVQSAPTVQAAATVQGTFVVPAAPTFQDAPVVPKAPVLPDAPAVVSTASPVVPVAAHQVSLTEEYSQPPVFSGPAFGNYDPSPNEGMPPPIATPKTVPLQMASPQMAMPYTIPPQVIQAMHAQHLPNGSVLHAISVTYHISQPVPPVQPDTEKDLAPAPPPSRPFSPDAQVFQPQQNGVSQAGGSRPRRGLGSSIFATGFTEAKLAGSFTSGEALH